MGYAARGARSSREVIVVAAMWALAACAQGGGDPDAGGTGGSRDARVPPARDGGGPIDPCDPRGYAATCQDATEVGALSVGDRFESDEALIPAVGGAQWLRVEFPPEPPDPPDAGAPMIDGAVPSDGGLTPPTTMAGGGAPAVRFLRNANDAYRIEIRTDCVGVAMCGEGGGPSGPGTGSNITEWSFTDTVEAGEEGAGALSTRDVPWPEVIHVRVYPIADPECGTYQLEIVR